MEACTFKFTWFLPQCREATDEEILTLHNPDHLKILKMSESMSKEEMEALSQKYDYLYFHKVPDQTAANNIISVDFFFWSVHFLAYSSILPLSSEEEINFSTKKMINCVKIQKAYWAHL